MTIENGNGELLKLIEARRKFLDGFHEAAQEFDRKLESLRDAYLEAITYTALNDPYLREVQRALRAKAEKAMASAPEAPTAPPESKPIPTPAQTQPVFYSVCPECGYYPIARSDEFCPKCAYPLKEGEEKDEKSESVATAGRKWSVRVR